MGDFKDYFSAQSRAYARFRPDYPKELIRYLLSQVQNTSRVWDCATGTGQVAQSLAPHFEQVVASDASAAQIQKAAPHPKIAYRVAPAENSGWEPHSFDLITVAQAIHWLDHARFYEEVKRVARPGALLAIWGYGFLRIGPEIDKILDELYFDILGSTYWPPERLHIDQGYSRIPFPFTRLPVPTFRMEKSWNLPQLIGYIHTWSAVQRFKDQNGYFPLDSLEESLRQAWGDPESLRRVHWPFFERMAFVA